MMSNKKSFCQFKKRSVLLLLIQYLKEEFQAKEDYSKKSSAMMVTKLPER